MTGKIAGIIMNDFSAAPGICLTVFVQGCPLHCPGCHNPEQQSFEKGQLYSFEIQDKILNGLTANGIHRDFCIMGGEPLCEPNLELTNYLINLVQSTNPTVKIYIWTGYIYENLLTFNNKTLQAILAKANYLIDGPYKQELRDITLKMRGSSNQRIFNLKTHEDITTTI